MSDAQAGQAASAQGGSNPEQGNTNILNHLLGQLEDFQLMIPDPVLKHELRKGGVECVDPAARRLLGLIAQQHLDAIVRRCRHVDGTDASTLTMATLAGVMNPQSSTRTARTPAYVANEATAAEEGDNS